MFWENREGVPTSPVDPAVAVVAFDTPDGEPDPAIRAAVRRDYLERFEHEGEAEVALLMIGPDLALATFPGEFFVEHGLRLKRESLVADTLFVGYSNGHLGYFPTIRAAGEGGYGADSSTIVEVGAGERLVDRALVGLGYLSGRLRRMP